MCQFEYGLRALSVNIQIYAYERAPRHLFVYLLSLTCDVIIYSALPHPRNSKKHRVLQTLQKHWRSQLSLKKAYLRHLQKSPKKFKISGN